MDKHSLFIFAVGFCCACATIKIKELNVPNSVEYGTIDEIILDCNYEANEETDLELKWYYNDQLAYQWIPGNNKPGSPLTPFKGLIDAECSVSNDSNPVCRALKITNITRHLTGNYTCKLSSFEHEDLKTKQLIIYSAPAAGLDVILDKNEQMVVCNANDVFPQPKINIYISGENDTRAEIDEVTVTEVDDDGLFNVTITHYFSDLSDMDNPTKFVCELTIPGTDYYVSKFVYYEEIDIIDIEDEDSLNLNDTYYNSTEYNSTEEYFNTTKVNSVMGVSSSVYLSTLLLVLLLVISK